MPSPIKPLPSEDLAHVLEHTRGLWQEAHGTSFFITGGTGFFGLWLLESFAFINDTLGLQMKACVLTRNPSAFAEKAPHLASRQDLAFLEGDVRDFAFPEGSFDHIIHAGTTSSAPVEPQEMFETIVDGTRRVLQFAAASGCRKLLFVSSGAVYGKQPPELTHIPEDYLGAPDPLDPASAYGEGKRAAEMLCVIAGKKHGFEIKMARCFAFVGPHLPLDAHFAIGNFIRDALAGSPIRVNGDGTPLRSYLYAADLAVWLWTLLFTGAAGCAYNVGSDQAVSIARLAYAVASLRVPSLPVEIGASPTPGSMPVPYVPDITLAANVGLGALLPLADALRRTLAWHLVRPAF